MVMDIIDVQVPFEAYFHRLQGSVPPNDFYALQLQDLYFNSRNHGIFSSVFSAGQWPRVPHHR